MGFPTWSCPRSTGMAGKTHAPGSLPVLVPERRPCTVWGATRAWLGFLSTGAAGVQFSVPQQQLEAHIRASLT